MYKWHYTNSYKLPTNLATCKILRNCLSCVRGTFFLFKTLQLLILNINNTKYHKSWSSYIVLWWCEMLSSSHSITFSTTSRECPVAEEWWAWWVTECTAVHVVEQNIKVALRSVNHRLRFTHKLKSLLENPRGKSRRNPFQMTLSDSDEIWYIKWYWK